MALAWAPMCLRVQLLPITKGSHWARPNRQFVWVECSRDSVVTLVSRVTGQLFATETRTGGCCTKAAPLSTAATLLDDQSGTMSQMWGPAGQLVHAFGGALGKQFQVGALLQEGLRAWGRRGGSRVGWLSLHGLLPAKAAGARPPPPAC